MDDLILARNLVDDDRPSRPDPLDDSLTSAQYRRYYKSLKTELKDDYGYSD